MLFLNWPASEAKDPGLKRIKSLWLAFIIIGGLLLFIPAIIQGLSLLLLAGLIAYAVINLIFFSIFTSRFSRREEELIEKSYIDSLTGLKNVRYFQERFEELLARHQRNDIEFALIFIDLDNFKRYNDKYGHTTGDELLQKVAQFMQENCRKQDSLIRYGGDEFLILSPDTGLSGARQAAERIKGELGRQTFKVNGNHLSLQLSGGVAVCPHDGTSKDELLEAADENLYQAKENGSMVTTSLQKPGGDQFEPPLKIGSLDNYIDKIERNTTKLSLLGKQGDLEIIHQTIVADKVFLMEGSKDTFEFYYLLEGKIIRQEDEKTLEPGHFITLNNTTDGNYFKTLTETSILFVSTSPIFQTRQEQFRKLLALNEEVAAKDKHTKEHCSRLQKLSLRTGEKLGLPEERLFKLGYASFLHDVGKVKIDSDILSKEEGLNDQEWEEMKKHPSLGKEIIMEHLSQNFFDGVAEIVHQHHENYDGSGYPQRLEGDEIMVEAQILSVADAYDAMTSKRPYSEPKEREEVLEELKKEKGGQFSPEVVEAFLEAEKELIAENQTDISFGSGGGFFANP